jgi:hypothetical protein
MSNKQTADFGEYGAHEIMMLDDGKTAVLMSAAEDSKDILSNGILLPAPVPGDEKKRYRGYVVWGPDNQLPYRIIRRIRKSEIMSQNKQFNMLTCYGNGLTYKTEAGEPVTDPDVKAFFRRNRPSRWLLEQCSDMKHFQWTVSVIILDRAGEKITRLVHKEACYCRLESCNPQTGRIEHLFYADWENKNPSLDQMEVITVLDINDPLGDLEVKVGRVADENGKKFDTKERKFAILTPFPSVGNKYYKSPPYFSVFPSGTYNILRLIAIGKEAKMRNHTGIKYHVEIHKDYFPGLLRDEKITDPKKGKERIDQEKQNIKTFLTGVENSNKLWISGFYIDPRGNEVSMIKITSVDAGTEGGDWLDDSEEFTNITCYADNVHPDIIGATPGKSKGGFSGSNQRELFTMKQSMEKPYHDIMLEVYFVISEFNGWKDIVFDIPVLMLTTLDKGSDAQNASMNDKAAGAAIQQQQQTSPSAKPQPTKK